MKSQHPSKFDRRATLKFCWWWNALNPAVWSADKDSELWGHSDRFEEKRGEGLFTMEWTVRFRLRDIQEHLQNNCRIMGGNGC